MAETLTTIFNAITGITAIIGIIYVSAQVSASRKSTRAQLWLMIDGRLLEYHDSVYKNLRPGGKWSAKDAVISDVEWTEITAYIGLFERMKVFLDDNLLDLQTFKLFYGRRVGNLISNPYVRNRIDGDRNSWKFFINLAKLVGYEI